MEIKKGDIVRVSEDAPRMYIGGFEHIFTGIESTVKEIEDDNAVIVCNNNDFYSRLVIPCKYLVKVDAEAKEPKIKVGDKVHVKGSVLLEGGVFSIIGADYHEKLGWRYELNNHEWYPGIDLEPYTEPTDQTEVEKKPNVGSIKIPVEVDLTDSYWDAYAADLAKEVALKLVNNENPDKIGEIAVSVAKAVVEGLKRK